MEMTARCAKPNQCWARRGQSWAQHSVRKDENETKVGGRGRGVQVRRGKKSAPREMSRQRQKHNKQIQRSTRKSKIQTRRQASGCCSNTHLRSRFCEPARRDKTRCWIKDTCLRMVKWGGLTMVNYTKMTQLFGLVTGTTDNDTSRMHTLFCFWGPRLRNFASIEIQVETITTRNPTQMGFTWKHHSMGFSKGATGIGLI